MLATSANGTRVMIQGNDFSIIASTSNGPKPPTDTYTVRFKTELERLTALRLEAQTFEELPRGGPGRDPTGGFVVSEIEVRDAAGRPLALQNATASTPDGDGSSAAAAIDGNTKDGGWALRTADGESHRLVVELEAPVVREGETTTLTLVVHQNAGGLRTLGRLRLAGTSDALPVRTTPGPEPWSDLIEAAALDPNGAQQGPADLARQVLQARGGRARTRARRAARRRARAPGARRRAAAVLRHDDAGARARARAAARQLAGRLGRGGDARRPAVPAAGRQRRRAGRATRLDLARWLTSRDNPLTARVLVNRLWKLFFGQGLSRSVEDLGAQGEWPTHPELLDWLARRVRGQRLGREAHAAHARDLRDLPAVVAPDARGAREATRTTGSTRGSRASGSTPSWCATTRSRSSGLLASRLGGPSVKPYQPAGYWEYLNFPPREWDAAPGDDQYRRGLYTWWQRTFLHPSLLAFDAPSREECTGERVRSNMPQQALALLNDPTYVEAARVFAERILRDGGPSVASRLRFAYARALPRAPNAAEQRVLEELLRRGQDEFGRDPAAAGRLVATGQHAGRRRPAGRRARGLDAGGAGDPEPAGAGDEVLTMRPLLDVLTDDLGAMRERVTRRAFLGRGGTGLGSVALLSLLDPRRLAAAAADDAAATGVVQPLHFAPRAKRVIHLYMAGGPSHLETFDSKPKLAAMHGQPMPESFTRASRSRSSRARSCAASARSIAFSTLRQVRPGDLRRSSRRSARSPTTSASSARCRPSRSTTTRPTRS